MTGFSVCIKKITREFAFSLYLSQGHVNSQEDGGHLQAKILKSTLLAPWSWTSTSRTIKISIVLTTLWLTFGVIFFQQKSASLPEHSDFVDVQCSADYDLMETRDVKAESQFSHLSSHAEEEWTQAQQLLPQALGSWVSVKGWPKMGVKLEEPCCHNTKHLGRKNNIY